MSIMLYKPKKDNGKDEGSIWRLVFGKSQYKSDLSTINMELLGDECFYIRMMMYYAQHCTRNVKASSRYLHETKN